jgi:hypothetical protein
LCANQFIQHILTGTGGHAVEAGFKAVFSTTDGAVKAQLTDSTGSVEFYIDTDRFS